MRFRLIYSGELLATQGGERDGIPQRRPEHKHKIRKCFHKQLKRLWETDRFLSTKRVVNSRPDFNTTQNIGDIAADFGTLIDTDIPLSQWLAYQYRENNYRFVPLVLQDFSLTCSIDVLFLRSDHPYSVWTAGDIDNRIKTLIDALSKPKNADALRGNEIPDDEENPFFCLLEDDKLVTGIKVEADRLLTRSALTEADRSWAEILIAVEVMYVPRLSHASTLDFCSP
jgi:hypothetical protein